jgi:hypothetical protein
VLTQNSLSLRVGEELDGRELGDGGVLDRVGVLVVGRLGSVVLLGASDIVDLRALLDVARSLTSQSPGVVAPDRKLSRAWKRENMEAVSGMVRDSRKSKGGRE